MPRKPQSPTQRRETLEATAGRAAREKDERTAKDASLDTSLTNVQNTNASQNTSLSDLGMRMGNLETLNANQTSLLQSHTADIVALGTRITSQENVNSAQATRITNAENNIAGHDHDLRYYGKGTADIWFFKTSNHPEWNGQKHGAGFHS